MSGCWTSFVKVYENLYIIAWYIGHETLCSEVMDEMLEWYDVTGYKHTAESARAVVKMVGKHMLRALRKMLLQFLAEHPGSIEAEIEAVECGKEWQGIGGRFEHDLPMMARSLSGYQYHLLSPSLKNRSHFHKHTQTPPCKEYLERGSL
jgi:hypothetical protein